MLSVLLILVTLQNLAAAQYNTISVPNGDKKGTWGVIEVCDEGMVTRGFQLKVQGWQGPFRDDTALNGIALFCTKNSSLEAVKIVRSSVGEFGSWGSTYWCDSKRFLINFSLRVESTKIIDKTAANNIKFTCSDGSVKEGDGRSQGTYGSWSTNCEMGIRGIETRVQKKQRFLKDDVALTDVRFVCREN